MEMLLRAALGLVLLAIVPALAGATEAICPGGANHDSRLDITWCSDFDSLASCTTGQESQCWTDNGYAAPPPGAPSPYLFKIVSAPDAAVGAGYATANPRVGSTGGGQGVLEPVPDAASTTSLNVRYYIRYHRYPSNETGIHGPQVDIAGDSGCIAAIKSQGTTWGVWGYYPFSCGTGAIQIPPNTPVDPRGRMQDGRWYLVEMHGKMDTSCTDSGDQHGCNGEYRLWVDEQLVNEYTDLNLGGVTHNMRFGWRAYLPENYYHFGVPPWGYQIDVDNFAYSSTGTYIGPAQNEQARGTGNPASPFNLSSYMYEPWLGRHAGPDCTMNSSGPTGLGPTESSAWRNGGGSLQSTITHGLYTDQGCVDTISNLHTLFSGSRAAAVGTIFTVSDGQDANDCSAGGGGTQHRCVCTVAACDGTSTGTWAATPATDAALQVTLTGASSGGGVKREGPQSTTVAWPQWVSYGWIYLPSTNNYTVTNLALAGFSRNFNDADGGYLALSVDSGNWAVRQRDTSGNLGTVSTATAVTFDTWHEYELVGWNDNTVSLMIDRARLLTKASLPRSSAWISSTAFGPTVVIGVIDFQGTPPFTVYYDDTTVTTVSAWSCDGWGSECPFNSTRLSRGVALGRGVKVR